MKKSYNLSKYYQTEDSANNDLYKTHTAKAHRPQKM